MGKWCFGLQMGYSWIRKSFPNAGHCFSLVFSVLPHWPCFTSQGSLSLLRERGHSDNRDVWQRASWCGLGSGHSPIPWSTEKAPKLASQPEVFLPCVQPPLCHQSHCPKIPSDHVRTSKISHSPRPESQCHGIPGSSLMGRSAASSPMNLLTQQHATDYPQWLEHRELAYLQSQSQIALFLGSLSSRPS